jgi:hypothetical protein
MHCDTDIETHVIYKASSLIHCCQYAQLEELFPGINFQEETDFKQQVMDILDCNKYEYVLFLVDDTMFVQSFSIPEILSSLQSNSDAIGFSLRLGMNTTYCYPKDVYMYLPAFEREDTFARVMRYDWTTANYDFGYPMEICSSVYRKIDLLPFLRTIYSNPNELEGVLAAQTKKALSSLSEQQVNLYVKSYLLCYWNSVAFTNPVNMVQTVTANRSGKSGRYSVSKLAEMYEDGFRIDVGQYRGFVPSSCHQEVELKLKMCEKK